MYKILNNFRLLRSLRKNERLLLNLAIETSRRDVRRRDTHAAPARPAADVGSLHACSYKILRFVFNGSR